MRLPRDLIQAHPLKSIGGSVVTAIVLFRASGAYLVYFGSQRHGGVASGSFDRNVASGAASCGVYGFGLSVAGALLRAVLVFELLMHRLLQLDWS